MPVKTAKQQASPKSKHKNCKKAKHLTFFMAKHKTGKTHYRLNAKTVKQKSVLTDKMQICKQFLSLQVKKVKSFAVFRETFKTLKCLNV